MSERETQKPLAELHTADGPYMSIALDLKSKTGLEAANLDLEHVLTFPETEYGAEKFAAIAELVAGVILRMPDHADYPSLIKGKIVPKGSKRGSSMTMHSNPVTMIIGNQEKILAGSNQTESALGLQGALVFSRAKDIRFEDYQKALSMILDQANRLLETFGQEKLSANI